MEPNLMVQILNFLSTKSLIYQSNKSEFQDIRTMSAYLIASRTLPRINAMKPKLMVQILNFLSTESLNYQSNKSKFQDIRTMSAYLIASRTNTKLPIHWLSTCSTEMELFIRKESANIQSSHTLFFTEILLNDANCFQSILDETLI